MGRVLAKEVHRQVPGHAGRGEEQSRAEQSRAAREKTII